MVTGADQPDAPPQGWYFDPFAVHEQRWFSQGRPTALVRDGRAEAQDPPPDGPVPEPLIRATAPLRPGRAPDDMGGPGAVAPDEAPADRFDFFGFPALPGSIDMSPELAPGGPGVNEGGGAVRDPMDLGDVPVAPGPQLRHRWFALAGAVIWSFLVALQIFNTTTTVTTATGRHTEKIITADPGSSVLFAVFLFLCCAVTGISFVRRVRAHSDRWSRSGAVSAGLLGVLGILSLATVGLAFLFLALLLVVVSRPIRRPTPLPGERVIGPAPDTPGLPRRGRWGRFGL